MVFPIAGGTQDTSYEISNSLMFEDGDTAYLNRTRSSQSNTTGTFSVWTKMGNPGADNVLFGGHTDVNNRSYIYFSDPDGYVGIFSRTSGSADIAYNSNGKFRDPSAWYHVVVAIDTTQGTEGNRFKMYINGTQYTDWGTATAPSQNASLPILNQAAQTVGGGYGSSAVSAMAEGYMADVYYIDGQQLDASNFGETNDNGVWIPKKYLGTYGTNGFKLEFQQTGTGQNASGIGADTSGSGNHLAVNNLIDRDVAVDTPTNNFAVLNSGANLQNGTVSQGNTKLVTHGGTSNNSLVPGTIGVQNGKWYVEVYFDSTNYPATGIMPDDTITDVVAGGGSNNSVYLGKSGSLSRFLRYDGQKSSSNSNSTYMAAVNGGDKVVQIALNMDDGQITFGANGQWGDGSGNTDETFANSTAAFTDINSSGDYTNKFAMFIFADENYGTSDTLLTNFGGCPPYAITGTVYSDANGYGKFKYEVPSGYYAVCTKNLAEYG